MMAHVRDTHMDADIWFYPTDSRQKIIMRMSLISGLTLLVAAPSFAQEVDDIVLGQDEHSPWMFIATDADLAQLNADIASAHRFVLAGDEIGEGRFELYGSGPVEAVEFRSIGPGESQLILHGLVTAYTAELRQGGIMIRWSGADEVHQPGSEPARQQPVAELQPDAEQPLEDFVPIPAETILSRQAELETESADPAGPSDMPSSQVEVVPSDFAPDESAGETGVTDTDIVEDLASLPEDDMSLDEISEDSFSTEDAGLCQAEAEAVAASTWDIPLMTAYAQCLQGGGEVASATSLYEQILAFEPDHFQAALGLAGLKAEAGDRDEARQLYMEAARSARTDGDALRARALANALNNPD